MLRWPRLTARVFVLFLLCFSLYFIGPVAAVLYLRGFSSLRRRATVQEQQQDVGVSVHWRVFFAASRRERLLRELQQLQQLQQTLQQQQQQQQQHFRLRPHAALRQRILKELFGWEIICLNATKVAALLHPAAEQLLLQRVAAAARKAPLPSILTAAGAAAAGAAAARAAAARAAAGAAAAGVTWETAKEPQLLRAAAAAQLQQELFIIFNE
ncbi:SOH1 domain-containing protein, putative [Eimeria necatrix]|uniref:SOH1 domain-containing protein, putative n=1 Tax=Eimeria necatrix TaxID=51315 RepID=U6MXZ5_9EIME|nr:SOH1 domain-containing protein, putative [Eimeria necatrix]CDJ69102.1 SOH1 domain-containing protein, putative [Eimeria necatrix]